MLRKIVAGWIAVALCLVCVAGCAKKSTPPTPPPEKTKTAAEYKAEADKQITQENADQELKKLEQSVDQETAQ
jgi:predicted small lipoprotein YifL